MPPLFITSYKTANLQLINLYGSRPRIMVTAGSYGSRVHAWRSSSDSATLDTLEVFVGKKVTDQADMGVGAFVDGAGGSDTLTRTVGSFINDGWRVGEWLFVQGSGTLANDFRVQLTGVSTVTLTFATGTVDTAENMVGGGQLIRASRIASIPVPPKAGQNYTKTVNILNPEYIVSNYPQELFLMLQAGDIVLVRLGSSLSVGETIDLEMEYGDYSALIS